MLLAKRKNADVERTILSCYVILVRVCILVVSSACLLVQKKKCMYMPRVQYRTTSTLYAGISACVQYVSTRVRGLGLKRPRLLQRRGLSQLGMTYLPPIHPSKAGDETCLDSACSANLMRLYKHMLALHTSGM